MLNLIQIAAILQLLIAFGAPADRVQTVSDILYKANSQTQIVPQGIGGIGSNITSKFVATSTSVFRVSLKLSCSVKSIADFTDEQKDTCLDWWLGVDPILADGGTNMPAVWYDYYINNFYTLNNHIYKNNNLILK